MNPNHAYRYVPNVADERLHPWDTGPWYVYVRVPEAEPTPVPARRRPWWDRWARPVKVSLTIVALTLAVIMGAVLTEWLG